MGRKTVHQYVLLSLLEQNKTFATNTASKRANNYIATVTFKATAI